MFWIISAVVLALSFWSPLALLRAEPLPFSGISPATVWTLNVMHVVVAAVSVGTLTILGRKRRG